MGPRHVKLTDARFVAEAHALFALRMAYVPSPRFLRGNKNYFKLINDYSGMMFFVGWLAAFGMPDDATVSGR